ncbi:hypothetical protein PFICI_10961 [Pestalotiopsis fici W106-1]|uniref:DUF7702 domain-containing protein n=1 Tax=Pestalotiopsis fici (strain W106-1 / CGMCC3.15140) TaxID=1229662 RepID=W3WVB3_PESFW|nr:uncharacterized protein PFICI_10961 [Pestalotiopsis fici W106-1]ETS77087.1 hypothetical protein PFICI_10961 [Pestalotiopsis fici W106-1]
MFTLKDTIYLIELAFYGPIIPAIIFVILLHGGKKPYTWRPVIIPLMLMSGLRIAGAAVGLRSLSPDKASLASTATILDTIGLAPVICLIIGLLIRANAPLYRGLPLWAFIPLQMLAVASTVMTAYGGRDLYTAGKNAQRDLTLMRVGIFLFITTFAVAVVLAVITVLKASGKGYRTEWAVAVCALLSVPFMAVRLTFSTASLFTGQDSVLNPMTDNDTGVWLHLFMVVIMEYIISFSATAVGLTSRRVVSIAIEKDDLLSEEEH